MARKPKWKVAWETEEHSITITSQDWTDLVTVATRVNYDEEPLVRRAGKRLCKKFNPAYDYLTSQDREDDREAGKDTEEILRSLMV